MNTKPTFADKVRTAHRINPFLTDMGKRLANVAHLCKGGKYRMRYLEGRLIVERLEYTDLWKKDAAMMDYINPSIHTRIGDFLTP